LLEHIRRSFDDFAYSDFAVQIRKIHQPALLAVASDISTGQGIWIVAPMELRMHENQIISVCAKTQHATHPVMYVNSFGN
jgi:hypothetical protein